MPTSKLLQTPKILSIDGSTIRIAHPDVSDYVRTRVASPHTAAGTALVVADNHRFADDDWFIVGEVGNAKTEECDVNGTVTRGTAITITNTTKFDHEVDSPVTKIFERGFKIYGAATDGGAGTLIASIDAIAATTNQLADAVMIQWNRNYSEYTLISTDTTYSYYYVQFTDGTTSSTASDYVAAAGPAYNSALTLITSALREVKADVDGSLITWEWLLDVFNDWQDEVTHFVTSDGYSKDWSFEITEDTSSLTTVQNTEEYSLSSLASEMKYPDSDQGVIQVKVGSNEVEAGDLDEIEAGYDGVARTEVATQASAADTTLVCDDTYEFTESGTIYAGAQTLTYTGNTEASATFTGIPASGTGSITSTIAVDTVVWQGISPGQPEKYTVFNGNIKFDVPVDSDNANLKIKLKYLYKIARLTSLVETTVVTIPHTAKYFIGSKIEKRKGNDTQADSLFSMFRDQVEREARKDRVQVTDQTEYYTFNN